MVIQHEVVMTILFERHRRWPAERVTLPSTQKELEKNGNRQRPKDSVYCRVATSAQLEETKNGWDTRSVFGRRK